MTYRFELFYFNFPIPCAISFTDWPDYTSSESDTESEVETIIGGKDGAHVESNGNHVPMDSTTPTEEIVSNINANQAQTLTNAHVANHHHTHSGKRSRTHSTHEPKEDKTAHKILNLLSEIGHSSYIDNLSFMEKQFHPCKYCKGRLQIL